MLTIEPHAVSALARAWSHPMRCLQIFCLFGAQTCAAYARCGGSIGFGVSLIKFPVPQKVLMEGRAKAGTKLIRRMTRYGIVEGNTESVITSRPAPDMARDAGSFVPDCRSCDHTMSSAHWRPRRAGQP